MKIIKSLITFILFIILTSFSFWVVSIWSNELSDWFDFLQKIVEFGYFLLWPFLVIAWKFLSNDLIYGSAFGIDIVLWELWQVVRIFANYLIWFIFISSLFIYFFKPDSNLSWKKNLPKVALSAIFINISWFLIAILIDISTILTLAAWSIGSTFNQYNTSEVDSNIMVPIVINTDSQGSFISIKDSSWIKYWSCIKDKSWVNKNTPCFSFKDGNFIVYDENGENNELTNNIWWISSETISKDSTWMLVSLFRYMNGSFLVDNTNNNINNFLLTSVKLLLIIVLIVPFILLSLMLVVRVVVLWVIIPLSPFILWAYILWIFDSQIKSKFKDIITLIFQPAYVVFMLSIWFVLIQSIHSMIPNNEQKNSFEVFWIYDGWEKTIDENNDIERQTVNIWENELFTIQSEYSKWDWTNESSFDYKNLLSYIPWIISNFLSAFVLWALVFIAFKSNSITQKISDPIENFAKSWLKTAPILPLWHSVASLEQTWQQVQQLPSNISQKQTSSLSSSVRGTIDEEDENKESDDNKENDDFSNRSN